MTDNSFISQKIHNYDYAPGIATYGADGKTGDRGLGGNNIFYTDLNVNDPTGLKYLKQCILNNFLPYQKSITSGNPQVISRSYQNEDLFFDRNGNVYQLINIDAIKNGSNTLVGTFDDFFKLCGSVSVNLLDYVKMNGERVIINTSTYKGFDVIRTLNTISADVNNNVVMNIVSDDVDQYGAVLLMQLSAINNNGLLDGDLNIYYDTLDNSYHISSILPLVIDGDVKIKSSDLEIEYNEYSRILTSDDTITKFKHIVDQLTYYIMLDSVNKTASLHFICNLNIPDKDKFLNYILDRNETIFVKIYLLDGRQSILLFDKQSMINAILTNMTKIALVQYEETNRNDIKIEKDCYFHNKTGEGINPMYKISNSNGPDSVHYTKTLDDARDFSEYSLKLEKGTSVTFILNYPSDVTFYLYGYPHLDDRLGDVPYIPFLLNGIKQDVVNDAGLWKLTKSLRPGKYTITQSNRPGVLLSGIHVEENNEDPTDIYNKINKNVEVLVYNENNVYSISAECTNDIEYKDVRKHLHTLDATVVNQSLIAEISYESSEGYYDIYSLVNDEVLPSDIKSSPTIIPITASGEFCIPIKKYIKKSKLEITTYEILYDLCTGCKDCIGVCKNNENAIKIYDGDIYIDTNSCSLCNACAEICLVDAIQKRKTDLYVKDDPDDVPTLTLTIRSNFDMGAKNDNVYKIITFKDIPENGYLSFRAECGANGLRITNIKFVNEIDYVDSKSISVTLPLDIDTIAKVSLLHNTEIFVHPLT